MLAMTALPPAALQDCAKAMFEPGAGRLASAAIGVMPRCRAAISAAARGVMRMLNCVSAARGAGAAARASSMNATRMAERENPARGRASVFMRPCCARTNALNVRCKLFPAALCKGS